MIVLDTDILTLLFVGHAQVTARYRAATQDVVTTIVNRVEVLQGRFATLLKAADGAELSLAQDRLDRAERDLSTFRVLAFDEVAAGRFDRLRSERLPKQIGRADILIASIALAHRVTLVTRNSRHFEPMTGLKLDNWAE